MKRLIAKYTPILQTLNAVKLPSLALCPCCPPGNDAVVVYQAPMDSGGLAASGAAQKDQLLVPMQAYLDVKSRYDAAVQSKH
eukprot:3938231-Rhodomonas_salina.1